MIRSSGPEPDFDSSFLTAARKGDGEARSKYFAEVEVPLLAVERQVALKYRATVALPPGWELTAESPIFGQILRRWPENGAQCLEDYAVEKARETLPVGHAQRGNPLAREEVGQQVRAAIQMKLPRRNGEGESEEQEARRRSQEVDALCAGLTGKIIMGFDPGKGLWTSYMHKAVANEIRKYVNFEKARKISRTIAGIRKKIAKAEEQFRVENGDGKEPFEGDIARILGISRKELAGWRERCGAADPSDFAEEDPHRHPNLHSTEEIWQADLGYWCKLVCDALPVLELEERDIMLFLEAGGWTGDLEEAWKYRRKADLAKDKKKAMPDYEAIGANALVVLGGKVWEMHGKEEFDDSAESSFYLALRLVAMPVYEGMLFARSWIAKYLIDHREHAMDIVVLRIADVDYKAIAPMLRTTNPAARKACSRARNALLERFLDGEEDSATELLTRSFFWAMRMLESGWAKERLRELRKRPDVPPWKIPPPTPEQMREWLARFVLEQRADSGPA